MGGETGDFLFDQGVGAGMGCKVGVGGEFQAVLGEFGGYGDGVGNDHGDDEFALIADDHGGEDVGTGLQSIFDRLGGHEFSGGGFEEIFLAVGGGEGIVRVEVADGAGF